MDAWVVIAAYNEEKHISSVVEQVHAQGFENIIVVDDGSKDKTYMQAQKTSATVLRHVLNCGKGAAVRTGCDYALEQGAQHLILMDGDGQHDPQELSRFLKALKKYDIVFGMRKRNKEMPTLYKLGNWLLSTISQVLFGISLRDSQCGYRAMSTEAYQQVRWDSSDYGMESEMIVRAGIAGLTHKEITVRTIYHEKYKGTTILDGIKIALNLLKWRVTIWS